jgi:uncharacterized protein
MLSRLKTLALASGLAAATAVFAQAPIPALSGPVIDEAALLSADQRATLDQEIRSFLPSVQLQVWTVTSLNNEPIESLSIRAVEKWKLGTGKQDNGVLILVSRDDRRMRIEVGQGLESVLPDALTGRIIDGIMKPYFREGQYYEGITLAAREIHNRATGEYPTGDSPLAHAERAPRRVPGITAIIFAFIILMLLSRTGLCPLLMLMGGRRRGFFGGSGWGGGGWGGGGGGGGGWSGGGGGFSGGGSSGNW